MSRNAKQRGVRAGTLSDVQGLSQLVVDAVTGVTDIVEDMHHTIVSVSPIVGAPPPGRKRGLSGWVYRRIRGVTHRVGDGLNTALAHLTPLLGNSSDASPRREAVLAALNGVLGDHLVASNNPLAIPMHLRQNGQPHLLDRQALATHTEYPSGKILVLAHGLCMNDLQWNREGHDHGAALAADLGYTPVYLHYNSGQHIATNGRDFAALMEQLVQAWPVPVSELVILGHSMGGLVAHSGCHYARQGDLVWLRHLKKLVCLGTPHHGAPLERAGNWLNLFSEISPYTAPFARLGKIRSAGIQDLRYGLFLDKQEEEPYSKDDDDQRKRMPLPEGVAFFVIAATKQQQPQGPGKGLPGDGLVPVKSALGQHENPTLTLPIPSSHQHICYGLNHLDLLSSSEVYNRIHQWLANPSLDL